MSDAPEDDDPWAPLPADQLWQRPGEEFGFGKRPDRIAKHGKPKPDASADVDADATRGTRPQSPPTPTPSPTPRPPAAPAEVRPAAPPRRARAAPDRADDPAAAAAFAELQRKLAAAPPGQSLVAATQRREPAKPARARRADAAADPTLAAQHVQGRDPEAEPVLEYAPGAAGRDLREEEAWFAALPPEEQQRLRGQWQKQRERAVEVATGHRRVGNRRAVAALACFGATVFAGSGVLWHATLGAGVLCALWWRRRPADRLLDPIRAVACLFLVQSIAMWRAGEPNPIFWMDCVVLTAFAAIVGFDGEIKRTGGFDQR